MRSPVSGSRSVRDSGQYLYSVLLKQVNYFCTSKASKLAYERLKERKRLVAAGPLGRLEREVLWCNGARRALQLLRSVFVLLY